jgi:hypothetical protein
MIHMGCSALRLTDLTVIDNDEPRIQDLRMAERLEFGRPRDIRPLIERNTEEMERYGLVRHHAAPIISGKGRLQTVKEYWLNEGQAILICMKSETPRAEEVRAEIIAVFQAYRHGRLVPASPLTADVMGAVFNQHLAPVHQKLDEHTRKFDEHSVVIKEMGGNLVRIERRVDDMVPKRDFSAGAERQYLETVLQRYRGLCPFNRRVRIVNEDGTRTKECHIDHFRGRELNGIEDGIAISREAHERRHKDAEYMNKMRVHFEVFHDNRRDLFRQLGSKSTRPAKSIPDDRQGSLI